MIPHHNIVFCTCEYIWYVNITRVYKSPVETLWFNLYGGNFIWKGKYIILLLLCLSFDSIGEKNSERTQRNRQLEIETTALLTRMLRLTTWLPNAYDQIYTLSRPVSVQLKPPTEASLRAPGTHLDHSIAPGALEGGLLPTPSLVPWGGFNPVGRSQSSEVSRAQWQPLPIKATTVSWGSIPLCHPTHWSFWYAKTSRG